jgi:hypothetical protein
LDVELVPLIGRVGCDAYLHVYSRVTLGETRQLCAKQCPFSADGATRERESRRLGSGVPARGQDRARQPEEPEKTRHGVASLQSLMQKR